MWWLITAEMRAYFASVLSSGAVPTAQQQVEYMAAYGYDGVSTPKILQTTGDTATITVSGVMTKSPSLFAMLFGGGNVTYTEIIAAIEAADTDPRVKTIEMVIDSPGGQVDGLFEAIAAMQARKKPLNVIARNTVASAAYALAAQADKIIAVNRAARVGSIGIVVDYAIDPTVVSITSTDAPDKRPDVATEDGRAVVRGELDAMHELFAEAIANGRGTTVEKINAEYGRGGTLLTDEAIKRGMIDGVQGQPLRIVKPSTKSATANGGNTPEIDMDLATLKAQYPAVFAAAVQEGVTAERERVSAHLIMGEMAGAMDTATAAIKAGTEMTPTINATYLAAAVNRRDQANRQGDSDTAAAAAAAAAPDNSTDATATSASQVLALVESGLGIQAKE